MNPRPLGYKPPPLTNKPCLLFLILYKFLFILYLTSKKNFNDNTYKAISSLQITFYTLMLFSQIFNIAIFNATTSFQIIFNILLEKRKNFPPLLEAKKLRQFWCLVSSEETNWSRTFADEMNHLPTKLWKRKTIYLE